MLTLNFQEKFQTHILELKRIKNPIKTIATIKAKKSSQTIINPLKLSIKSETLVKQSYIKIKNLKYQINSQTYLFYIYFSFIGSTKRKLVQ